MYVHVQVHEQYYYDVHLIIHACTCTCTYMYMHIKIIIHVQHTGRNLLNHNNNSSGAVKYAIAISLSTQYNGKRQTGYDKKIHE